MTEKPLSQVNLYVAVAADDVCASWHIVLESNGRRDSKGWFCPGATAPNAAGVAAAETLEILKHPCRVTLWSWDPAIVAALCDPARFEPGIGDRYRAAAAPHKLRVVWVPTEDAPDDLRRANGYARSTLTTWRHSNKDAARPLLDGER